MTSRTDHWAVWLTLLLCVLAFVLGAWLMPGPSDTEAAADTAADLRDAIAQARAAVHGKAPPGATLALRSAIHKKEDTHALR